MFSARLSTHRREARCSKLSLTLLICLSLCVLRSANAEGTFCTQIFNFDAYYSLENLKATNYYSMALTTTQGTFTYPISVTPTTLAADFTPLTLYYNFCSTVTLMSTDTCKTEANANPAFILTIPTSASDCTTVNKLTTDSKFENYEYKLMDEDKPQTGIVYTISRSDQSIDGTTQAISTFTKSITYAIYCDSSNTNNKMTTQGWRYFSNTTNEMYFLQFTSNYGCPTLKMSKIWSVLEDSKVVISISMIGLGALLCFFGLKMYQPTLFMIGNLSGVAAIVVVMGEWVIRYDSKDSMAYVCLIVAIVFGAALGYVTLMNPRAGFFALGMWLGVVMALLFNNAVLYKIQIVHQSLVLWMTICILSVTMGLLSCFFYRYCVIVCTGFIGSYCLIRPLGWMIGSFPNELSIAQEMKYGTITEVPSLFYLYFALIFLVGLIGIKFQYSMYLARREDEEQHDFQQYLADPDFIEMNQELLEKDDEDLTEKEKELKKKVLRMQKNVDKEKKRQEAFMFKADKLKKKKKGSDDDDDDDDDENSENSDDDYENQGNTSKAMSRGRQQSVITTKSKVTNTSKGKKNAADSDDSDEENRKEIESKKKQLKLGKQASTNQKKKGKDGDEDDAKQLQSNLFAGIKKQPSAANRKDSSDADDANDIEMDDLSEADQNDSQPSNVTKATLSSQKKKGEQSKNAAKLAKASKKGKK